MQSLVDKFLLDTINSCMNNGVTFLLSPEKNVIYPNDNIECSGYFVDRNDKTLAVATGSELSDWLQILSHESSHMDQWTEQSNLWTNLSLPDGNEASDILFVWIAGTEVPYIIKDIVDRVLYMELDAERRAAKKVTAYNLPIDLLTCIQKSNAYIYFYRIIEEFRIWYPQHLKPYQIESIWTKCPTTFDNDYSEIPADLKNEFLKIYKL